jgi:hypothetical protein
MSLVLLLAAAGALAVAPPPPPSAPPLEPFRLSLACFGTARVEVIDNGGARFSDEAQADLVTTRQAYYDGVLRISIVGAGGVIDVPDQMLPSLRGGRPPAGGFPLTALDVGVRTIVGRFSFNQLNRPTFAIDRTTGQMEMSGLGTDFSGRCARASD